MMNGELGLIGLALPAVFVWHYLGRKTPKQPPRRKSKDIEEGESAR